MSSVSYLMYQQDKLQQQQQQQGSVPPKKNTERPPKQHPQATQPPVRRKSSEKKKIGAVPSPSPSSVYLEETNSKHSADSISESSLYTTSSSKDDHELYTSFRRRASFFSQQQQQSNINHGSSMTKSPSTKSPSKPLPRKLPSRKMSKVMQHQVRRAQSLSTASTTNKSRKTQIMIQDLLKEAGMLPHNTNSVDVTSPPRKLSNKSSYSSNTSSSPSSVQESLDDSTGNSPTSSQKSAIWRLMVEPQISQVLQHTLENVMDEVLLMDDAESIQCTCPDDLDCFYHSAAGHDSSSSSNSFFDYNQAPTPAMHNSSSRKSLASSIKTSSSKSESTSKKVPPPPPPLPQQRQHSYSSSSDKLSIKTNANQDITFIPETSPSDASSSEYYYAKFLPPPPPSSDESQPSRSWGRRLPDSDIDESDHSTAMGYAIPHGNLGNVTVEPRPSMNYKQLQQQLLKRRSRHPSFSRASSILSLDQTIVSEMSDEIKMEILPPLRINPKAPQYQMMLEQQQQQNEQQSAKADAVRTCNNRSPTEESGSTDEEKDATKAAATVPNRPTRRMSPAVVKQQVDLIKPPARRSTPPMQTSATASMPKRHISPQKTKKATTAKPTIQSSSAMTAVSALNVAAPRPARHVSPKKKVVKAKATVAGKAKAISAKKLLPPLQESATDGASSSVRSTIAAASLPTRHVSPRKKAAAKPKASVDMAAAGFLPLNTETLEETTTDHSPSTASDVESAVAPVQTPPPPSQQQAKNVSDLVSPGILTSVDVLQESSSSDESKPKGAKLKKPGRVSTLTYPSFGSHRNEETNASKSDSSSEKKISPQTLPPVEDAEMQGSDDEDIGDAPRHLECTPSIDSSDITNSYGTSTSSSMSLMPYHSRAISEGDDSLPPLPPKRRDNSTGSNGNGKAALEQSILQQTQAAMEDSMTGPFISPRRDTKKRTVLPNTPQQDSNPLLFPMTIASKEAKEEIMASTIVENTNEQSFSILDTSMEQSAGPFVESPSKVQRSFQARTPQQESNPLLFPKGLKLYPDVPFSDDEEEPFTDGNSPQQSKSASAGNSTVRRTNVASECSDPPPPPPLKHQQDIEFIYTPSPVHDKSAIPDIDLSQHDLQFDSDLHDTIDLSHVTPEQILHKSATSDKSNQLPRTKSSSDRGSRNPPMQTHAERHPSKQDSPHSIPSQPFAPPRRSVSFPQSVVSSMSRPESSSSSGTGSSKTRSSRSLTSSDETTTTSGGEPSETSSPFSHKSHSSRFTVSGSDPATHFSLVVNTDEQMEPSVFTGEDESEYDEDRGQDDCEIVVEETVEYPDSSADESEYSEYYEEMSVVMEEEEYEDESHEDESLDDVTALDDQSEQYESLKDPEEDEYEDLNDAQERRREYLQSTQMQPDLRTMPSLVSHTGTMISNTSSGTMISNTSSEPSSLSSSSSITVCRVKFCPMEICYVIEGEDICYTGFYSGPVNGRAQANGNGIFWFNTGDVYVGQFANGNLHGCGMLSITVDAEFDAETGDVLTCEKQILKGYFRWNEYVGTDPIGAIQR